MNSRMLVIVVLGMLASATASATTTNMTFVGGCPEPHCGQGTNATALNVAAILGVDPSYVTQVGDPLEENGSGDGFSITGVDQLAGNWEVSDSSITHLAFKANGYFILGKVGGESGTWDGDIAQWIPDFDTLDCPAAICGSIRSYTLLDFRNNGGEIAELSNVRAFSVVPLPAAAWLFLSALAGLFGLKRYRQATA